MNAAADQKKEKNENTVKGERQEKRENNQPISCCPSAVVQRAARRKNGLCEASARGN